jgi:hypothetical protein
MAVPHRPSLYDLPPQVAQLEQRIQKIESALNQILGHLNMPKLEGVAPIEEPKKAVEVIKTGQYIYQPLDTTKSEIRLLMLQSSTKDDEPVKAQIQHYALEADGRPGAAGRIPRAQRTFKALSYTWGDVSKKVNITLNGHQFPVTENLFAALKNIRNANKAAIEASSVPVTSFWWIDAICINQDNVLERNAQVGMMTRIYRKSYGVHIWLGEASEDSDLALELVDKITSYQPVGPGEKEIIYPDCNMEEKVRNCTSRRQSRSFLDALIFESYTYC